MKGSDKPPVPDEEIVNRGVDDVSLRKRYNPFTDEKISVKELMERETSISSLLLTDGSSTVKKIVSDAIKELELNEIEFVTDYFFIGLSLDKIAEKNEVSVSTISALKGKIVNKLMFLLQKYEHKLGLGKTYTKCVLCNCANPKDVDAFIKDWLDSKGWKFYGIISALKSEFDVTVSISNIMSHIRFHMDLPYTENQLRERVEGKEYVGVYISAELKNDIRKLAETYGYGYTTTLRHCVNYGYLVLKHEYAMNLELFQESMLLAKVKDMVGK